MAEYDEINPDYQRLLDQLLESVTDEQLTLHAQTHRLAELFQLNSQRLGQHGSEFGKIWKALEALRSSEPARPPPLPVARVPDLNPRIRAQIDALRRMNHVSLQSGNAPEEPGESGPPAKQSLLTDVEFTERLEKLAAVDDELAITQLELLPHLFALSEAQKARRLREIGRRQGEEY